MEIEVIIKDEESKIKLNEEEARKLYNRLRGIFEPPTIITQPIPYYPWWPCEEWPKITYTYGYYPSNTTAKVY